MYIFKYTEWSNRERNWVVQLFRTSENDIPNWCANVDREDASKRK